jgi:hypothetical protein
VGASNFADDGSGRLELCLLDPQRSAAGLALRAGKLVECSVPSDGAKVRLQLGDVERLLEAAPGARVMLCLPLRVGAEAAPALAGDSSGRCFAALQGALLLGMKEALSDRWVIVAREFVALSWSQLAACFSRECCQTLRLEQSCGLGEGGSRGPHCAARQPSPLLSLLIQHAC